MSTPAVSAPAPQTALRLRLARRGRWLQYLTIAWNALEFVVAVAAGAVAGSIALVGFGIDSAIEVTASLAALWRLAHDGDECARERAERRSLRIIGTCFLALAAYVTWSAVATLVRRDPPEPSVPGLVLASLSLLVMPMLAHLKRRIARGLASGALTAESRQTQLCAYLSAILVAGLALNALAGWWWADPIAALAMVPLITKEGLEAVRGRTCCE